MYSSRTTELCTHGGLNDVLIVVVTLALHIHIYKEAEVIVQGVYTMYNIYLQILREILLQQSETHLDHSFWAWTLVSRRGTSMNSISFGNPWQLKFILRISRAVDMGMDWVRIWPLVRVIFRTSCRKVSTRRYRAGISGRESQR